MFRDDNFVTDIDKAILAICSRGIRAATRNECFTTFQFESEPEPRYGASNRPLGNSTFARTKAVVLSTSADFPVFDAPVMILTCPGLKERIRRWLS